MKDDLTSMRDINPFGLRMPPQLRKQVEESAKENKRSLNAEILARLEESFVQAPPAQHVAQISSIADNFSPEMARQIAQAIIAEMDKKK